MSVKTRWERRGIFAELDSDDGTGGCPCAIERIKSCTQA